MSTRQKMEARFPIFFVGDFAALVRDILLSSVRSYEQQGLHPPRTHINNPEIQVERAIRRAESLAKDGLISRAVSTL